jgi:hypothetical protein
VDRAQFVGQGANLLTAFDVAAEQDVAGGIGVTKKSPLVGGQREAGNSEDCGCHSPKIAKMRELRKFAATSGVDSAPAHAQV